MISTMDKIKFMIMAIAALIVCSCGDNGMHLKKTITGKAGEVVVVVDKANWEAEPGTALRNLLAADYPMLPQKEPAFSLVNVPKASFSDLFQSHRNIIIMDINSSLKEDKLVMRNDIWATPQIVIYLHARSSAGCAELINKNAEVIYNAIEQAERDRIIRNSKKYEEASIRKAVAEKFGGSPYFPNGYSIKKATENFMWISYETTYINQYFLIYSLPFNGKSFPGLDTLISRENEVLKKNVPGPQDNSYMIIASEKSPTLHWYKYKNESFAEMRGLWEVQNDFMGGPFVEHIFYAKDGKNLLVVMGFVYAPRYNKRNYLRQVEAIIYSFDWQENFQNQ